MRTPIRSLGCVIVIAFANSFPVIAQRANAGEIHGLVVEGTSLTPSRGATVDVTAFGGTTLLARVITAGDGVFRVPGLKPGRYHIHVRRLGFTPWDLASVVVRSSSVNVGTVALTPAPLELQSVAVTDSRADVQLAPDRNTYVVRDLPAAKGGNALDVLRTVPAVDVDIDNVVSLRGDSGVTIQINGRPSPLKPAQLGDFLAQLPADMVDKVEIIPNPSARDDPTGVAGIINIVLKQQVDAGTSGGATLAGAATGQANAGVNIGYDHKGLSLYGSYGFLRDHRPQTAALFRQNEYATPLTYLDEFS
ncbi:MAG: TonB-dependent receptor, partial [Gemmatimonadaceae bacterium]